MITIDLIYLLRLCQWLLAGSYSWHPRQHIRVSGIRWISENIFLTGNFWSCYFQRLKQNNCLSTVQPDEDKEKLLTFQVFFDDVVILEGQCYKSRPFPEFPQVKMFTSIYCSILIDFLFVITFIATFVRSYIAIFVILLENCFVCLAYHQTAPRVDHKKIWTHYPQRTGHHPTADQPQPHFLQTGMNFKVGLCRNYLICNMSPADAKNEFNEGRSTTFIFHFEIFIDFIFVIVKKIFITFIRITNFENLIDTLIYQNLDQRRLHDNATLVSEKHSLKFLFSSDKSAQKSFSQKD